MPDYINEIPLFHTRGYLPHQESHTYQAITMRLYDSLPAKTLQRMQLMLKENYDTESTDRKVIELRKEILRYEDAGHGQCFLSDGRIAEVMEKALQYYNGEKYELIRWCVMPNHVHVIIKVPTGQSVV